MCQQVSIHWLQCHRKGYGLLEAGRPKITDLIWINVTEENPVLSSSGEVHHDTARSREHITR